MNTEKEPHKPEYFATGYSREDLEAMHPTIALAEREDAWQAWREQLIKAYRVGHYGLLSNLITEGPIRSDPQPIPTPAKCPTCGSDNPKRAYCCIDNKCGICPDLWHDGAQPIPEQVPEIESLRAEIGLDRIKIHHLRRALSCHHYVDTKEEP